MRRQIFDNFSELDPIRSQRQIEEAMNLGMYVDNTPVSHTGDTLETTLVTVTIPGGLLQANSIIEVLCLWSLVGGNSGEFNMFGRVYFGGTKYMEISSGEDVVIQTNSMIWCNNSIIAQKGVLAPGDYGLNFTSLVISAVNTALPVDITFKAQLERAEDTVTLEGYRIKIDGI